MHFKYFIALAALAYVDSASAGFPISGVKTGIDAATGATPARLNLLDLYNDVPKFSLYIQALNALQQVDENDLTSYFQLGGIHGRPYIAWDNIGADPTGTTNGIPTGYCTHGNILFPLWHRPYLAVYEQVLAGLVQDAAKNYNDPLYSTAADYFRIPFWDSAAIPQRFPDIMTWPSIRINTPSGPQNVTNPLYRYTFLNHPEPATWFPPNEESFLGSQPWTIRQADGNNVSQEAVINQQFGEEGQFLTDQVWSIFAKTRDYNAMATNGNGGSSFEGPHGTVHVLVGGNGHMTYVSFAGFEPAFMLHHANVDRQIAMWQAIYPDQWIQPAVSSGGTWTIYPNTEVDENTPLTPFTTGDGNTLYTSVTSRYTKNFGYSYPDVPYWEFSNPADLSANVTARVNLLYNSDGHLGTWPAKRSTRVRSNEKRATERDWSVAVKVPNAAVGEPFSVKFTVGSTLVGKMVVLSTPSKAELDAGGKRVTYAEFTLKSALNGIGSDDIPAVVAHLKGNLKWSVVKNSDGSVVSDVPGLEVEVADEILEPAGDVSKFPSYGDRTVHPEIME